MKHTEKEKKAIENSKEIIQELNNRTDKDFIGRLYFKNIPIEDILQLLLNLIEKQQKEITRLENIKNICPITNTSGIRCDLKEAGITIAGADYSLDDYIPKEAIREKIEELNRTYVQLPVQHMKVAQIQVLKELLGE